MLSLIFSTAHLLALRFHSHFFNRIPLIQRLLILLSYTCYCDITFEGQIYGQKHMFFVVGYHTCMTRYRILTKQCFVLYYLERRIGDGGCFVVIVDIVI